MKKKSKKFLIRLIIAIIVVLIFLKWINIFDSVKYIKKIAIGYFILASLTVFIIQIVKATRFYFLAKSIKVDISYKKNLLVHFVAPIIGRITPARVGEGSKVFFFKKDRKKLGFSFIVEKLADIATLLVVCLFAIFTFSAYFNSVLAFIILFVIGIIMLLNIEKILNFVLRKNILEDKWFKKNLKQIPKKQLTLFIINSIIVRFLVLTVPFIIALSLNLKISYFLVFQMYALSMIIGWLSGLPGGIGTREFVYSFLLITYANIPKEIAGIASILVIFTDLLVESSIALVGYIIMKLK